MSFAARTVLVVIAAALTVVVVWAASRVVTAPNVEFKADPPPANAYINGIKGQYVGTAGCLGAACHGAPAGNALAGKIDEGTWQSSGSCWVAADPHTAAYSLLTDEPHRRVRVTAAYIMDRYAPGTKATEDARCLACHSSPALAEPGKTDDARILSMRAEGVTCETCHGNAGGWLRQHTTWKGDRASVYDETGMTKLYDVGVRAITCAGCHVGAPEEVVGTDADGKPVKLAVRDMNHDMIAAGHPRLNFDFAEYQRRLPAHWQEKDRTASGNIPRGPEFVIKAWLIGRVAHAEAACKLLASQAERAKREDPKTPWPEFAEYNCAACHHELPAAWRGQVLDDRPAGAPPWQAVWPVTPAIGLAPPQPKGLFQGVGGGYEQPVQELLQVVQGRRFPAPAKVIPPATKAAESLRSLRLALTTRPDAEFVRDADRAFGNLNPVAGDWDSGLQMLFGLAAVERSRPRNETRDALFRDAFNAYNAFRSTGWREKELWPKVTDAIGKLHPKK